MSLARWTVKPALSCDDKEIRIMARTAMIRSLCGSGFSRPGGLPRHPVVVAAPAHHNEVARSHCRPEAVQALPANVQSASPESRFAVGLEQDRIGFGKLSPKIRWGRKEK